MVQKLNHEYETCNSHTTYGSHEEGIQNFSRNTERYRLLGEHICWWEISIRADFINVRWGGGRVRNGLIWLNTETSEVFL